MKRALAGLGMITGMSCLTVLLLQACGNGSSSNDGDEGDGSTPSTDATTADGSWADATGSSSDGALADGAPGDAGTLGIPATFFGQHVNHLSFPLKVPYGAFRFWDTPSQWGNMELCDPRGDGGAGCFKWDKLDQQLAQVKAAGVDDVLFTLGLSPPWAAPAGAGGVPCDYGGTSCYPPRDLAADGSGSDDVWIGWVTALGQHVNDPTYLTTHAHVRVYEPWNEFYRAPLLTSTAWPTTSFQGTFAQLVRMTEDVRCVIKGVGTVHNYPAVGDATPCATLLTALGQKAIDPDALISTPSSEYGTANTTVVHAMQNFLYCTANPSDAAGCTTGNAGSLAVDIINLHLYPQVFTPETGLGVYVPSSRGMLSKDDQAKPLISGEGSWGSVATAHSYWAHDAYERAGFIPRYFALGWSAGLAQMFWYAYDNGGWGQLYSDSADGGGDLAAQEGPAWTTTFEWLVGAVPTQTPFCRPNSEADGAPGTVYTCDFLQKGTTPSRLVWDSSFSTAADGGHGCLAYADEWRCGSGTYTDVAGFTTVQDLSGAAPTPITGGSIVIGANPVLLQ